MLIPLLLPSWEKSLMFIEGLLCAGAFLCTSAHLVLGGYDYTYTYVRSHHGTGRNVFQRGWYNFFPSGKQSQIVVADSDRMGQPEKAEQTQCFRWCKTEWKGTVCLVTKETWILGSCEVAVGGRVVLRFTAAASVKASRNF